MELKLKDKQLQALSTPDEVMKTINQLWNQFPEYDKARENLFILYLNIKNELLCVELHSQGTIDQSIAYPREIIRKGLFCNAAGIILIHNHISGHCYPSKEDKTLTTKVKDACQIMDLSLLDHIIITDKDHYSFQEENLI